MAYNTINTLADKGHLDDITFVRNTKTGLAYIRPRHNKSGKGIKTLDRQKNNTRWRNPQNAYEQLKPLLDYTFAPVEKNGHQLTEYQKYLSANEPGSTVFLTKEEADAGACVLEPFVLSTGRRLREVQLTKVDNRWVSNILCNNLEINEQTTVGEFSAAVINSNILGPDGIVLNPNSEVSTAATFCHGDKLMFYRVVQKVGDVPYIFAQRHTVVLDAACTLPLRDVAGTDGFLVTHTTVEGVEGDYLSCLELEGTGVAYMQSRRLRTGQVVCSPSRLKVTSRLLEKYSGEEQMVKAIETYGGVNRVNYARPDGNTEAWRGRLDQQATEVLGTGGTGGDGGNSGNPDPTYTISFRIEPDASWGSVVMVPAQMPVARGTQVRLTATAAALKRFGHWSNGSTEPSITVTADSDRTLTATFENISNGGGNDINPGEDFGSRQGKEEE